MREMKTGLYQRQDGYGCPDCIQALNLVTLLRCDIFCTQLPAALDPTSGWYCAVVATGILCPVKNQLGLLNSYSCCVSKAKTLKTAMLFTAAGFHGKSADVCHILSGLAAIFSAFTCKVY